MLKLPQAEMLFIIAIGITVTIVYITSLMGHLTKVQTPASQNRRLGSSPFSHRYRTFFIVTTLPHHSSTATDSSPAPTPSTVAPCII